MSFDIYGRSPINESGQYQRFYPGKWKPMYELIRLLCEDLLDPQMLDEMAWDHDAGPTSPVTCEAMADRFDKWLETNHDGYSVRTGSHLSNAEIEEWVRFLRHCCGFSVS